MYTFNFIFHRDIYELTVELLAFWGFLAARIIRSSWAGIGAGEREAADSRGEEERHFALCLTSSVEVAADRRGQRAAMDG